MKYTVTIEELISQDFEIEANALAEAVKRAREIYSDGILVVENGTLESAKIIAEAFGESYEEEI